MRLKAKEREALALAGPTELWSHPSSSRFEAYKSLWRRGLLEMADREHAFGYVAFWTTPKGEEERRKLRPPP